MILGLYLPTSSFFVLPIILSFLFILFFQELKQAYEREAEILGSSLGDGAVMRKEIISDVNTLLDVAVLCETMVM